MNLYGEVRRFITSVGRIPAVEVFASVPLRTVPYKSVLVANGTILLIETASYFLKRQIQRKSAMFLENGGFSERMHSMRCKKRNGQ